MNLRLLAIGKITNSKFKLLCDHYLKNINAINKQIGITNVEMIEINKALDKNPDSRKDRECKMILKKINLKESVNIILEEKGKPLTTQEFKNMLNKYLNQPRSEINFIIGGPDGTSRDLSKIANETISLSKMTLPHLMARVILIEQLYRSLSIIINHPYHRD